jgi:hypothetical protein
MKSRRLHLRLMRPAQLSMQLSMQLRTQHSPMLLRLSCCLRLASQEWPVSPMMQGPMQPVEFAFDGVADEREKVTIPVISAYGIISLAFPVI